MDRIQHEDRLSAYFDGELPANERSEMEAQLRESAELRRILADFETQRQSFAALAAPALPFDFSDRIMGRVLEIAASSNSPSPNAVTPPPFPLKPKRSFALTYVAAAISVAAMIALAAFITREFWNPPAGGSPLVAEVDENKSVIENDAAPAPEKEDTPDSAIEDANKPTLAANENKSATEPQREPEAIVVANSLPKNNAANEGNLAGDKPIEAITNANVPSDSSAKLVDNMPKAAIYAAATSKARPKAYRVQIGARSEFDARLREVGVSIFYGKSIDPPSAVPRAQPAELAPDPEYVIVEGSESQLAELVEKLGAQADLMLFEPKDDLEAKMLIESLCRMDLAGKPLRPSDAKEGEFAAFTIPAKALATLIPANLPTGNKPNLLTDFSKGQGTQGATPKALSSDAPELYVPRLVFILDVRIGEAEGAGAKK